MSKIRKLVKGNADYFTKINNKYQGLVVEIECYIRAELNSIDSELALKDMFIKFLDVQDDEKKIQEIIQNKNSFCTSIVSKYKKELKLYNLRSLLSDYLPIGIYALIFFVFMDMITIGIKMKPQNFDEILKINYTLKLLPLIGILISFLIGMSAIRNITKSTSLKKGVTILINFLGFTVSSAAVIVASIYMSNIGILTIVQFTAFRIGISLLVIAIVVFSISTILESMKLKKKI